MRKIVLGIIVGSVVLFGLIQLVPYGRNHNNPAVVSEPNWISPEAKDLAVRACFDCHSNETTWPWYAQVAPISWLIQHDVDEGRQQLNFSEWRSGRSEGHEMSEVILRGSMPPAYYILLHPPAKLTDAEKQLLAQALQ